MTAPRAVVPIEGPVDAEVIVPGSKSHSNRALVCAALASGSSTLRNVLRADDTEVMLQAIAALGATVSLEGTTVVIGGTGGQLRSGPMVVDVALSGTTARFLAPVLAAAGGDYTLDGAPPLRRRPMAHGLDALRGLGATIVDIGEPGRLPVQFPESRLTGDHAALPGDASSQFLSGLLMVGPTLPSGLTVRLTTELVSAPYVDLTVTTMKCFGADVTLGGNEWVVAPTGYRGTELDIEPDASASSYFFAAAAVCGGRVRVDGLGRHTAQGDLAFVDVLAAMGAEVTRGDTSTEVRLAASATGRPALRAVDVDLRHCSDTAQTVAAVAVFADSPTRVRGIGFIRAKETDRIGNVVAELRRCGIEAHEHDDGFTVVPGAPQPAVIQTYDDHRMAMSFALLGLRAPGIEIADPECVAKTFPGFWDALDQLRTRP